MGGHKRDTSHKRDRQMDLRRSSGGEGPRLAVRNRSMRFASEEGRRGRHPSRLPVADASARQERLSAPARLTNLGGTAARGPESAHLPFTIPDGGAAVPPDLERRIRHVRNCDDV